MTADEALTKRRELLAVADQLPIDSAIRSRCLSMAAILKHIAHGDAGAEVRFDAAVADYEAFTRKTGPYAPDYKPSGDPVEILRQIRAGS